MTKSIKKFVALILGALLIFPILGPLTAKAAITDWQKGASISPMWDGEFGTDAFKQSVDKLAADNANYISLIIPLYQSNTSSTDIQKGGNTPTDAALISAITYAHSKGLKVMLKPHLETYTYEWRAYINPGDRNAWFTNYGNMLAQYAKIAKDYGVEDFCLGAELISMASASVNSDNTQAWKNLIAKIRGIYPGKLTYSANWGPSGFVDEKNNIQFWDSLDYIGIAAYFNLYSGSDSSADIKSVWNNYLSDIQGLSQKWNKNIVFTEIGYKSVDGARYEPWNYNRTGSADLAEQANLFDALFSYWNEKSFMKGVQIWDWKSDSSAGGAGNTDYTPQNKTAEGVIAQWFGQSGPPAPVGTPYFQISASINPNPPSVGKAAQITLQAANSGDATGNIIVDIEIYNSAHQKISQDIRSGQNFMQGQSQTYTTSWTPPQNGNYTLKVGIFNYNWSELYLWNDNTLALNTTVPSANTSLEIWWPTSGATISGTQPFKGLVPGMDVGQYSMYWQVDGHALNAIDYPHKEASVDVSNWTWNGSGPYTVTFIAKDLGNNIISQRSIQVSIWR